MVAELDPGVVGVPVMVPVEELMVRPAGRPVAVHETVAVDDESWDELLSGVMAEPVTLDWLPGLVTVTVLVMFQVNVVLALNACESVAVTVTEQAHAVVGVPVITPEELMLRPAGRPVAPNVTELPPVVSCGALMVRELMPLPETFDWVPGLVTDRLSTFQVRETDPALPELPLLPPAPPLEL
jgi:hypothetical protein